MAETGQLPTGRFMALISISYQIWMLVSYWETAISSWERPPFPTPATDPDSVTQRRSHGTRDRPLVPAVKATSPSPWVYSHADEIQIGSQTL